MFSRELMVEPPGGKGCGGGGEDHNEIADFVEVGHDIAGFAIELVRESAVVKGLVLVGIAHAIPEKEGIQALGNGGEDQAPDSIADKVAVDLCAGGKAPAKLGGKGHKGNAQGPGAWLWPAPWREDFLSWCALSFRLKFGSVVKLDHFAGVQNELVIKGQFDGFIETDHPIPHKLFQIGQAPVAGAVLARHLSPQLFGQGV